MTAAALKAIEARADAAVERARQNEPPPFYVPGNPDSAPPKTEPHPLTRFIAIGDMPMAPRWIIPGVVAHGVVTFAGAPGIGKTSVILPLAMVAAGLHAPDDPLAPRHWRHVVFISEDHEQAQRILIGMCHGSGIGITMPEVRERIHIVPAQRMPAAEVVKAGSEYAQQFTRVADGAEVLPLIVFDTLPAIFATEEENANSEASRLIAHVKQDFHELPAWIVGHVAKDKIGRADVESMSLRGGGAFEGDANQTIVFFKETDGTRYLALKKCRFEPRWPELKIDTGTLDTTALNEYGEPERVTLRWGIPRPPEMSRAEAKEAARADAARAEVVEMRTEILDAVDSAWRTGYPHNRSRLKATVSRRGDDVGRTVEKLLAERWLYEVTIPTKLRANPNASAFLIRLDTPEHEHFIETGELPAHKLEIPTSVCKPKTGTDRNERSEDDA